MFLGQTEVHPIDTNFSEQSEFVSKVLELRDENRLILQRRKDLTFCRVHLGSGAFQASSELLWGQKQGSRVEEGWKHVVWSKAHLPFGLGTATHLRSHSGIHFLASFSLLRKQG